MQERAKWRPPSAADKRAFSKQQNLFKKKAQRPLLIKKQIQFVIDNITFLNTWEREFIQSLAQSRLGLSPKQDAILDKLTEKITYDLRRDAR